MYAMYIYLYASLRPIYTGVGTRLERERDECKPFSGLSSAGVVLLPGQARRHASYIDTYLSKIPIRSRGARRM